MSDNVRIILPEQIGVGVDINQLEAVVIRQCSDDLGDLCIFFRFVDNSAFYSLLFGLGYNRPDIFDRGDQTLVTAFDDSFVRSVTGHF